MIKATTRNLRDRRGARTLVSGESEARRGPLTFVWWSAEQKIIIESTLRFLLIFRTSHPVIGDCDRSFSRH
jgi:hypothetical protein